MSNANIPLDLDPADPPEVTSELIAHAKAMYKMEREGLGALRLRGRLILTANFAVLAASGTIAGVLVKSAGQISIVTACIFLASLILSLRAAFAYLTHPEDQGGVLKVHTSFASIAPRWTTIQPSTLTVSAEYLFEAVMRELRMNVWQRFRLMNRTIGRGIRIQNENRRGHTLAIWVFFRWQLFPLLLIPRAPSERVATDLEYAFRAEAITLLACADEFGRTVFEPKWPCRFRLNLVRDAVYRMRLLGHGPRVIREKVEVSEQFGGPDFMQLLKRIREHPSPEQTNRNRGDSTPAMPNTDGWEDEKPSHCTTPYDPLHPNLIVQSSTFYLQFSEAHWIENYYDFSNIENLHEATSRRRQESYDSKGSQADSLNIIEYIHYREPRDPPSLKSDARTWHLRNRIVMSWYFAAQELRTKKWNLWYLIRKTEELLVSAGHFAIFGAIVLLVVLLNPRIYEQDAPTREPTGSPTGDTARTESGGGVSEPSRAGSIAP